MGMEKYGQKADEKPESDGKVASDEVLCPVDGCGEVCEKHGDTIICPKHGTKPFAKETDDG